MSERRAAARASPREVRRTLQGRYELAEVIGRGGMGTVYRAFDLVLGRPVAIKTLSWLIADQHPNSVARFEREARAAAALSHPGVVAVYDTGVEESTHFIVMELVAGRSLEAVLRDEAPLEPDRAVAIAAAVADALAAAHAAGIVHRDIKPANVMLAEDGSVKVLDFGIARAKGANTLTQTSSVLGTAAYMAPEQAEGKPADERSDIYALGCVLYALLAGHPPFDGAGLAAILHRQANTVPAPLRDENPRVSPALSALVMKMLAKSSADRPRSAAEVRRRLTSRSGAPPLAAPATAPTARMTERQVPPAPPHAAPRHVAAPRARRRLLVVGALAGVVLIIALVALVSGAGAPHRAAAVKPNRTASTATVARRRSPATAPATSATPAASAKSATSATNQRTTASTPTAPPPATVPAAAAAVTALITGGVHSGTVDPQAGQQIATGLTAILNSWRTGKPADAQHHLVALTHQMTVLAQGGQIASAVAPTLSGALANLGSALASATPAPAPIADPHPPGHGIGPAGHNGLPPGRAKHLDDHRHYEPGR